MKAQSKSLSLTFERSPTVPQFITADEGKLRQILINLLNNAIKFTHSGTVGLTVSENQPSNEAIASPSLQAHTLLSFAVSDTGVGIPATQLEQIFGAFEQTEVGKQSSEGTGLGLSICSKFAEFMRGGITINSELGIGSVFTLVLPVTLAEASYRLPRSPDRTVVGLAPNQPDYRLLVVEDRWESRHFLVKLLETIGFQVREAQNGAEAIAIWEEWQPHLIWMDMRMPIMDGYEATRQIKSNPAGQSTIIIALTASALEEEKAAVLSAGCEDFIRKPFQEGMILAKLTEYLGVLYIYQDESNENPTLKGNRGIPESNTDLKIYLSSMPNTWIVELYEAATLADNDLLATLIQSIPSSHTALARALINLIDNFDYNQIMILAQQVLNPK